MQRRLRPAAYAVVAILSLPALGCQPGDITGGGEDFGTSATEDTSDAGRSADARVVGEAWGPCPTDETTGVFTLCFSEDVACVPADFSESNICLPLSACPDEAPTGTHVELGWGDACYPRCESDTDCAAGMVCGRSVADDTAMCAWPL